MKKESLSFLQPKHQQPFGGPPTPDLEYLGLTGVKTLGTLSWKMR